MNWRRTRPVHITQERLVFRHTDTREIASGPVTSITLSKTGGGELMLIAMGRHVGVFRADASGEISLSKGPQLLIDVLSKGCRNIENCIINNMKVSSSKLVATGSDHSLRMIDLATGSQHTLMEQHTDSVWGLSLDRGSSNNWDEGALGACRSSDNAIDNNNSSSGSSSGDGGGGNLMIASSSYGSIKIFDADRGWKPAVGFQAHSSSWIRTLHLDIDRNLLISGSADSTCKAWDLRRPGEVLMRYVHPNHFEEIRGVECVGNRLFTGCYDGMVREYELDSGGLKGVVANHGVYAVECLSLSRETGRLVSVDWDGVLAVGKGRPLVDVEPEVIKEDTSVLCFGERCEEGWMEENELGSSLNNFVSGGWGNNSHLRPDYGCEATRGPGGRITFDVLGPALDRKEDLESSLSAKVICMQHNQERLVMGTKSGDIVSLLFRKGLCGDM
jgi:WD40 repeat protein